MDFKNSINEYISFHNGPSLRDDLSCKRINIRDPQQNSFFYCGMVLLKKPCTYLLHFITQFPFLQSHVSPVSPTLKIILRTLLHYPPPFPFNTHAHTHSHTPVNCYPKYSSQVTVLEPLEVNLYIQDELEVRSGLSYMTKAVHQHLISYAPSLWTIFRLRVTVGTSRGLHWK